MGGNLGLALLDVGALGGNVGGVDVVALRDARPLVGDGPEEADRVEAEEGPRETDNGLDARALRRETAPGLREVVGVVLALETVAEGSGSENTSDGTEEDTAGQEHEEHDLVAELPVEEREEKVEDGGEEAAHVSGVIR